MWITCGVGRLPRAGRGPAATRRGPQPASAGAGFSEGGGLGIACGEPDHRLHLIEDVKRVHFLGGWAKKVVCECSTTTRPSRPADSAGTVDRAPSIGHRRSRSRSRTSTAGPSTPRIWSSAGLVGLLVRWPDLRHRDRARAGRAGAGTQRAPVGERVAGDSAGSRRGRRRRGEAAGRAGRDAGRDCGKAAAGGWTVTSALRT